VRETLMRPGNQELGAQRIEIGGARATSFYGSLEEPVERFAQQDSACQSGLGIVTTRSGQPVERPGLALIDDAGGTAPVEQISVMPELIPEDVGSAGAAAHGIDKVEAEPAADEFPALLICFNLSHHWRFVTGIVLLTGYQSRDIL
jgi:hypothetical protein